MPSERNLRRQPCLCYAKGIAGISTDTACLNKHAAISCFIRAVSLAIVWTCLPSSSWNPCKERKASSVQTACKSWVLSAHFWRSLSLLRIGWRHPASIPSTTKPPTQYKVGDHLALTCTPPTTTHTKQQRTCINSENHMAFSLKIKKMHFVGVCLFDFVF